MPTFIKTGFWEKAQYGFKGWLNLDQLILQIAGSIGGGWPLSGPADVTGDITIQGDSNDLNLIGFEDVEINSTGSLNINSGTVDINSQQQITIEAGGSDLQLGSNGGDVIITNGDLIPSLVIKNAADWEVNGAPGTEGQVLTSNGVGVSPEWKDNLAVSTTVTIPTASVLTANSSPYELIPAPGAGRYIVILGAYMSVDYAGVAYATNVNVIIRIGTTQLVSSFITISNTADKAAVFQMQAVTIPINQNCNFFVQNGNPTDGNSDVKVTLVYKILDI